MKYSILGFNQELVCELKKEVQREDGSTKTLCLDVTDLLILKNIADFMNRSCVVKLMINDNVYFSITHKTIIEDLPILGIKKQALKDRIDKMAMLGIIEEEVLRNECGTWIGYRLTDVYERLRYYDAKNSEGVYKTTQGGCSELHEGGVVNYNPNNNTTINNTTINNNNKEEKELKEKFANFVSLYKKAGGRIRGVDTEFNEFTKRHKDWKLVIPYLEIALKRETKARNQARLEKRFFPEIKNLRTYLGKQRAWELYVVIGEDIKDNQYEPQGRTIWFNEDTKSYWTYDNFYYEIIDDGYTDEERPDGAEITLNNGRGTYRWNSNNKKWEKK